VIYHRIVRLGDVLVVTILIVMYVPLMRVRTKTQELTAAQVLIVGILPVVMVLGKQEHVEEDPVLIIKDNIQELANTLVTIIVLVIIVILLTVVPQANAKVIRHVNVNLMLLSDVTMILQGSTITKIDITMIPVELEKKKLKIVEMVVGFLRNIDVLEIRDKDGIQEEVVIKVLDGVDVMMIEDTGQMSITVMMVGMVYRQKVLSVNILVEITAGEQKNG